MKSKLSALVSAVALAMGSASVAHAQVSGDVVKIGLLPDISALYSDLSGPGTVVAAKMAVEDHVRAVIPGDQAFRPLSQSNCLLVKK